MSQALGGHERVRTTHSILSRSLLARALAASKARVDLVSDVPMPVLGQKGLPEPVSGGGSADKK